MSNNSGVQKLSDDGDDDFDLPLLNGNNENIEKQVSLIKNQK